MIVCELSTLLGAKRWSQRELCRRTGLHPVTVSRLFHDEWQEISRDVIDRVCRALGVDPGELFRLQPSQQGGAQTG